MKMLNWNTAEFEAACIGVTLDRLEAAGHAIAQEAKNILEPKLTGMTKRKKGGSVPWKEHGPYETGQAAGQEWTDRHKKEILKTIRVVRKKGDPTRNIWIIAGNFKVWWALQMEYGKGGWHGKAKSFMRPAMKKAAGAIQSCLEGGSGQTKGYK